MRSRRSPVVLFSLFLSLAGFVAQAAAQQCNQGPTKGQAKFCDGYYALCIKAKCTPTAPGSNQADCVCQVEQGWSMGPAPCTDPGRKLTSPPAAGTELMSTYSNLFNTSEHTLTCLDPKTQWAWCYGAPCKVDEKNPSTAICRCPICTSAASTLGGSCTRANCRELWSAATPKDDKFANNFYYEFLTTTKKDPQAPPPATRCVTKP
jgi:hypothetical protein